MLRNQPVILFSGGLDSFCMYQKVKKESSIPPKLVYFHLGLPENDQELKHMKKLKLYDDLIVNYNFRLKDWKLPNEVLPFRNVHLVLGAFHYGSKVYLGATASSTNRDKREQFAEKLLDLAKFISHEPHKNPEGLFAEDMEIMLPFADKTKTQFIKEYLEYGDPEELLKTRSCYAGDDKECGKCASCIRKFVALTNNGLPMETEHQITIEDLEKEKERAESLGHIQVAKDTENCINILKEKENE